MMEVYAGFVSHADHHFGRILDTLEQIGELENTLIMVISDNGASAEGGVTGSFNEMRFFNQVPESFEDNLAHIDDLGGPSSYNHYAWGWAWAGDTPFRRWKRETYRGGSTDPFVVAWPAGMAARGEVRTQYAHAIDMVPTVLDALGVAPPATLHGATQTPLEGVSFAHTFDDAAAPSKHVTQYFEMFGHRAIYHDGWRAVCPWPAPNFTAAAKLGRAFGTPITADVLEELDRSGWELYRMADDPCEGTDLAAEHPEVVRDLVARWGEEAEKYKVLPLDGTAQARLATVRPQTSKPRSRFVYYPGGSVVPAFAAPPVYNRAYSIEADVDIPAGGAEGVLLSQGGDAGGYAFYLKNGRLCFLYNYVGLDRFEVLAEGDGLTEGRHALRYEFEPTGAPDIANGKGSPGRGQLYIDGKLVGASDFPHTTPLFFELEGLSCGFDFGAPAAEYDPPFPFTGTIRQVSVDIAGELIKDDEAELRLLMARQ
jgi:arylsulfatase